MRPCWPGRYGIVHGPHDFQGLSVLEAMAAGLSALGAGPPGLPRLCAGDYRYPQRPDPVAEEEARQAADLLIERWPGMAAASRAASAHAL